MVTSPAAVVVGIGGPTAIFALGADCAGRSRYTAAEVWAAVERYAGLPEGHAALACIEQPQMVVPKLCLLYAVMQKVGVGEVQFEYAMGGCPGLLTHPAYWE
jgi:hypothetical protein